MTAPILLTTRQELDRVLDATRGAGERLALVPTMGALHEGHLSLLDQVGGPGERRLLTIFVNPLQFGPGEDLTRYPRELERDVELAVARGADWVFAPPTAEMYPAGDPVVQVTPGRLGERLCGPFRPGHFQGVLTVVARLLAWLRPEVAVFGRKDLQQSVLIRRMVEDLGFPVRVVVAPLVREPDGLALSSRNVYLGPDERHQAVGLSRGLRLAAEAFEAGERRSSRLVEVVSAAAARHPLLRLQYVEVVDPEGLEGREEARKGDVLALAAFCGGTRLIDNVELGRPTTYPPRDADTGTDAGKEPGGPPDVADPPGPAGRVQP